MSKSKTGVLTSPEDSRDWNIVKAGVCTAEELSSAVFPSDFILKDLPPVYCQWFQSTCVPHALATVKAYYTGTRQSTDFIYANRSDEDFQGEGMVTRQAIKRLKHGGSVLYGCMPGNHNYSTARRILDNHDYKEDLLNEAMRESIGSYYRISSLEELKMTLIRVGPAVITVNTYGFPRPVIEFFTGKFKEGKRKTGGHAMVVIGWKDETTLIVRNSYSALWGNNGNGEIDFETFPVKEMWGIIDSAD